MTYISLGHRTTAPRHSNSVEITLSRRSIPGVAMNSTSEQPRPTSSDALIQLIDDDLIIRLKKLVRAHLSWKLSPAFHAKFANSEVVQSALRTFLSDHRAGMVGERDAKRLWHLLAMYSLRKWSHMVRDLRVAKRNLDRETRTGMTANENDELKPQDPIDRYAVTLKDAEKVAEAIKLLSEHLSINHFEVLLLRANGDSWEAIGSQLKVSERTARTWYAKALVASKRILDSYDCRGSA
jgi:hypothetical protein